jgi:hypothetical protein
VSTLYDERQLVADNTLCPRCGQTGLVRVEHVIQGGRSYRVHDCVGCAHQWRVLETGEHVPSGTTDQERPDRSRSRLT